MRHLNISIDPHHYNNDAEVVIDDGGEWPRSYILKPAELNSEQDLRNLLSSEPDYIYNAMIGLLKEMAS